MRYQKKRIYEWSSNLAYIVGLISSDGCLSKDGRHIDLTSKDEEQLTNFCEALGRNLPISTKPNGHGDTAYRVQFSDVALYDFLNSSGLTPHKSFTMPALKIPDRYFVDFLRGNFDGDGSVYGFVDTRWRSSFMYYVCFVSASRTFIEYLEQKICSICGVGSKSINQAGSIYKIAYAKKDAAILFQKMYYSKDIVALSRKRRKLEGYINGGRDDILL